MTENLLKQGWTSRSFEALHEAPGSCTAFSSAFFSFKMLITSRGPSKTYKNPSKSPQTASKTPRKGLLKAFLKALSPFRSLGELLLRTRQGLLLGPHDLRHLVVDDHGPHPLADAHGGRRGLADHLPTSFRCWFKGV